MNKLKAMFQNYADELLYKVQWPSLTELQGSTVTVLVASLLIALTIGIMDFVFSGSMKFLYQIFN